MKTPAINLGTKESCNKQEQEYMQKNITCKTVRQYNSLPVSEENMKKLTEIAKDYQTVKNYVYQRYGGIQALPKLYPGYTIQNEMTESGLRQRLRVPSVYFYLAVFDALGDIKAQWAQTKNKVLMRIRDNPGLTPGERHYLRFAMKMSLCFESILLKEEIELPDQWQEKYRELSASVDECRLKRYLCRQVRNHLKKMHTDKAEGFSISERAYRYDDHGIYISVKEKRKRIFIPLTDGNRYKKQLYIRLYPEEGGVVILAPVEVKIKSHTDYDNEVGLAIGMKSMFVTDKGRIYGEKYGEYQTALTEYVKEGTRRYRRNKAAGRNTGRKKYYAGKGRLEAALHTYINTEINRLLAAEKPRVIYIPKLPQSSKAGNSREINHSVGMWQKGYVRSRLIQKCREQSVEICEVYGKDISNQCSLCGALGNKKDGSFFCPACGRHRPERENTAGNVLNRGRG